MAYLIIFLSLYAVYCGLLYFFQTKLMFPADFAGPAGSTLPTAETERIELPTDQGKTVAWFVPAPAPGRGNGTTQPMPLVVFFHGNAELIDHQRFIIDLYHGAGVSVLLVEYRGYGDSDGTPSQKHIVADTLAVLTDVLEREDVDADRLVLHGRSIGGGMAAQVALRTEPKALIVESTFTSVSGMAWRYGVPPFLVRSPLNSAEAFKELDVPILIMHGRDDEVVPAAHAGKLDEAANDSTLVYFNAQHNTLPNGDEVQTYEYEVAKHLDRAGILGAPSVSE
ncbi:MAG: alpha/beta hydrolase [Phycisphaeraceae bacterium]